MHVTWNSISIMRQARNLEISGKRRIIRSNLQNINSLSFSLSVVKMRSGIREEDWIPASFIERILWKNLTRIGYRKLGKSWRDDFREEERLTKSRKVCNYRSLKVEDASKESNLYRVAGKLAA